MKFGTSGLCRLSADLKDRTAGLAGRRSLLLIGHARMLHENASGSIPLGKGHRLANPDDITGERIEIQADPLPATRHHLHRRRLPSHPSRQTHIAIPNESE